MHSLRIFAPAMHQHQARWLVFCLLLLTAVSLRATHIVGGGITYLYMGDHVYEITLKVYRDCLNGQAPFDAPAIVSVYNDNGVLVSNLYLNNYVRSDIPADIYDPCYKAPTGICVELATYIIKDTLDNDATGFTLSYQRCCRNYSIRNIQSPGDMGTTFTAYIPRRGTAIVNSSPVFKNEPPLAVCLGSKFRFDHSATDSDGDVLIYRMCTPLHGGGPDDRLPYGDPNSPRPDPALPPPYSSIIWRTGYSATQPIDANPSFSIDPNTGLFTGTPIFTGQYVFAICVEEYRSGVLLSTTRREYQINITTCISDVKAIIPPQKEYCAGYTVKFGNKSITAPFFHWDFGVATSLTDTSRAREPEFTFPDSGVYNIRLVANPGLSCADTTFLTYRVNPALKAEIKPVQGKCISNPVFNFEGGGKYESYTAMNWDFGPSATPRYATGQRIDSILYPDTGIYEVQLLLSHAGCINGTIARVRVFPHPELDFSAGPEVGCAPLTVRFAGMAYAKTPVYYIWRYGEHTTQLDSFVHVFKEPGNYRASVTAYTREGCIDTVGPMSVGIKVLPSPIAGISVSDVKRSILDPVFEVTDDSRGAIACRIYFGEEYVHSSCDGTYRFAKPGRHEIVQMVENIYGCKDTVAVLVHVTDRYSVFIPNTFTPSRDGKNEHFYPVTGGVFALVFEIYNRWGNRIFMTQTPGVGWDGTDIRTGNDFPVGVYVYRVVCTDSEGNEHRYYGEVHLIR